MKPLATIKSWARRIKRDALTLWFACRHPATPWPVKALCGFVVAYALSPIDLIPDFIPVLGYVDDALLLPGLIWLAVRLLPEAVVVSSRAHADAWMASDSKKPRSVIGAVVIVVVWLAAAGLTGWWAWRRFGQGSSR